MQEMGLQAESFPDVLTFVLLAASFLCIGGASIVLLSIPLAAVMGLADCRDAIALARPLMHLLIPLAGFLQLGAIAASRIDRIRR
jgi:hypothetical protein